ncbi:hypothetical protein POVWA2_009000 [Plasmodium ovale wallikeri]|uniref:Uncharacterized protein n=2 Tax=Plasmodium ovale TaxID=36330 RepID=A0A1A9APT3_PLAOA|nr:hypothetical protein POVWA2_009000 [Plasmodium ovale wallikeri]SBT58225.1 hypothetical protein POVWA1_086340 [Plasmodium ovale wallikeri]SBT72966.1 Plasmodium exported protein, unknown function [Plasmodium ovale]
MKFNNKSNVKKYTRNGSAQMKKWLTAILPVTPLKLSCKNTVLSTIALFLNIIILALVFYESPCSYNMKERAKYSPTRKEIYGSLKIGNKFGRVLEAEQASAFEEYGKLFGQEDEEVANYLNLVASYPVNENEEETYEEEQNVYDIELEQLIHRISDTWNVTIENMINDYVTYTSINNMDVHWRDEMWNERWYKYLESIHTDLSKFLQDENLSLDTRESIAQDLLFWTNNDFKIFLNIVKEEWELKNSQPVLTTDV